MIKQFIFIISLMFCLNLSAQEKMTINNQLSYLSPLTGNKSYSKYITDLKKIPDNIKLNLDKYLSIILENMNSKLEFKDGYISDLKGYYKENPKTYDKGWIASKYQFAYRLSKPEIGIESYIIKIDMDEFGQIIKCNWPREWYKEANRFIDRSEIEKTALKWSEQNTLLTKEFYEIELKYNEAHKTLCWVFKFPENSSKRNFSVIEIDWRTNKIVAEYSTSTTVSE